MKNKKEIRTKLSGETKKDVEERLKKWAEKNGYHTNVPIFNDSYQTEVAKTLANEVSGKTKTERVISDQDLKAIFRFSGYSSIVPPPIS
jgi:UDP-N-acetylglucosamine:LPS N-acetylglucosamine transferase